MSLIALYLAFVSFSCNFAVQYCHHVLKMANQSKLILPNVSLNIIFLLCRNWDDTSIHFQMVFYLFDSKFET